MVWPQLGTIVFLGLWGLQLAEHSDSDEEVATGMDVGGYSLKLNLPGNCAMS